MAHVLSGRAETPTQSRILTQVRDEGPLSRIDLAARLGVSRTTVAAEVGRLVELGLAEDAGPAASRGGRRSTLVDLDAEECKAEEDLLLDLSIAVDLHNEFVWRTETPACVEVTRVAQLEPHIIIGTSEGGEHLERYDGA